MCSYNKNDYRTEKLLSRGIYEKLTNYNEA